MALFDRFVIAALVGVASVTSAQETAKTPPVEDVVIRPVTPGTLGLLARAGEAPAAHEYVRKAVRHADANTRAAAARMAYVLGVKSAVADLRAALETETSPDAAAEQASALLRLLADEDEAILRLAARVDRLPLERASRRLAFLRPAATVARLPLLGEIGLSEPAQREVLEIAILAEPRSAEALGKSILDRGEAYSWGFFLGAYDRTGIRPATSLLVEGLGKDVLRATTLQWIAAGAWYPGPRSVELFEALNKLGPRPDTLEALLLEIVRRQGGRRPVPWSGKVGEEIAAQLGPLLVRPKVRAVLTDRGRAEFGQAVYGDPLWLVEASQWAQAAPLSLPEPELVAAHPPGFLASLVLEAGCEAKEGDMIVAHATFDDVGLPRELVASAKASGLTGECGVAGAGALWTHVSPLPRQASTSTTLVLSLAPDGISCSVDGATKSRDIADVWGKKTIEPERIKRPRPVGGRTPAKGISLSVEIAPNGCVRSASPTLGADVRFVPEALRTIAGWRYPRFTSEGKPVSFRTVAHVSWRQ